MWKDNLKLITLISCQIICVHVPRVVWACVRAINKAWNFPYLGYSQEGGDEIKLKSQFNHVTELS